MSDIIYNQDRFRHPEIFLKEILRKAVQGTYLERDDNVQFMHRAVVLAVDVDGGLLENPTGNGKVTHTINGKDVDIPANIGPENPKNSIKAMLLSGDDRYTTKDDMQVFWPFMQEHISVPIKPGEHVYVIFEDASGKHGLWMTKIPGQENVNFFQGSDAYKKYSESTSLVNSFPESNNANSNNNVTMTDELSAKITNSSNGRLAETFGVK